MCLVVIVDDRATNRAIYTQLARSIERDVEVRSFADPEEALNWLATHRADLIVTDYDMPRLVGDEFISRFRVLPQSGGVPIMMITVCDRRQLRLRALESGATDFLQAPIDHCEFLTRARNLLKLRRGAAAFDGPPAEAAIQRPEGPAPAVPPEVDDEFDEETRGLLDRCGQGGYAFHFIEIAAAEPAADLTAALQRHLRGGDLALRIDPLRYVLLQSHVEGQASAQALARRLILARDSFVGVASFRIGSALPRAEIGPARARAVACLREAHRAVREAWRDVSDVWRHAGETVAQDNWGAAPVVDLQTGALAGAQLLSGLAPAEAVDPDAMRAALACIAERRVAADEGFRLSLRLDLDGDGAEAVAPRLAASLAAGTAEPSRLELILCARQIVLDQARAGRIVDALNALGVSLMLDLGDLPAAERLSTALTLAEGGLPSGWRHAIRFPCRENGGIELAGALRAGITRLGRPAPLLLADGVPTASLLSPLRRAGASRAQGPCFGAPFALRGFGALLAARPRAKAGAIEAAAVEARSA